MSKIPHIGLSAAKLTRVGAAGPGSRSGLSASIRLESFNHQSSEAFVKYHIYFVCEKRELSRKAVAPAPLGEADGLARLPILQPPPHWEREHQDAMLCGATQVR